MSVMNQGKIARLLQEGVNSVAQTEYNEYPMLCTQFLNEENSDKAYEVDVSMAGTGPAALKPEGSEIQNESEQQLYTTVYQNRVYAKGTIITFEAIQNDQYENRIEKAGKCLARSLREAEELVGHDVINDGYDSSVTYGDGEPLFSDSHKLKNGTFSNQLNVYAELSEASLEDACIQIRQYKDPAGNRINVQTQQLLVPVELEFEAARILQSQLQNDTANNALNVLRSMGKFPGGVVASPYFTDGGAWTVTTNIEDGGKFMRRMPATFRSDNSNTSTWNYHHSGITYFSVGSTDPRWAFGSRASA